MPPPLTSEANPAALVENRQRPLRVLHLIAVLASGGVERWVVNLCEAGRSDGLDMDMAVLFDRDGLFATRARESGINVYHCDAAASPFKLVRTLRRLLREHGPYDALHCHVHAFNAFAVLAARLENVPARVAHSHNVVQNSAKSTARRFYIAFARNLLRMFATAGLAPAAAAAEDLFGPRWRDEPRWQVLPCGLDLAPFRAPVPASSSRASFGIPPTALVLGSVGRLCTEKNSGFLLDVLFAVLRTRPDAYLLLIGEGPLREALEQEAQSQGYRDRLILTGPRPDVPALLRNVMDVFVFPSPPPPLGNEALPLAMVEAQAAGLNIVASDGVPPEAIIVPDLVIQIRADAGAERWAEAVLKQAGARDPEISRRALVTIEKSGHNCEVNMKVLAALYRGDSLVD